MINSFVALNVAKYNEMQCNGPDLWGSLFKQEFFCTIGLKLKTLLFLSLGIFGDGK